MYVNVEKISIKNSTMNQIEPMIITEDESSSQKVPSTRTTGSEICKSSIHLAKTHSSYEILPSQSKENSHDLPYEPPPWASKSASHYSFEVVKAGVNITPIELTDLRNSSFVVVGRLPSCDIVLEHPSISRYHAVIQFGKDIMEPTKGSGWYLYDLDSTHGSKKNQQSVPSKQFIRLHVGHVLQFGCSSRLFILHGAEEDIESESRKTMTELKIEGERRRMIAKEVTEGDDREKRKEEAADSTGISYGITNDSDEEGESGADSSGGEDLDLESLQKREQYYIDNPKKTLARFFNREGYELKYEYEEKTGGFKKNWQCKIELPVDTPSGRALFAEVEVTGNKREAQIQCALEACRILDAHNILRRSDNVARRKKIHHLKDNDYYDSDEDTFYDRTGELEEKRLKRKRRLEGNCGGVVPNKSETYISLNVKAGEIKQKIAILEIELKTLNNRASIDKSRNTTGDSLDDFMLFVRKDVGSVLPQDLKVQKSQLSLKLVKLKHEADRVNKMLKIAKPVPLPALKSFETSLKVKDARQKTAIWVGSMKGPRKSDLLADEKPNDDMQLGLDDDQIVEEEDDDDEIESEQSKEAKIGNFKEHISSNETNNDSPQQSSYSKNETISKRSRHRVRTKRKESSFGGDYDANNPDYVTWMPPDNQTGDGRTKLNQKFADRY